MPMLKLPAIKIHAVACPWNEPNSFGEIVTPDTFKGKISHPLTMRLDHCAPIGFWHRHSFEPDGLHVWGRLTDEETIARVLTGGVRHLSISYDCAITPNSVKSQLRRVGIASPRVQTVMSQGDVEKMTEISLVTGPPAYAGTKILEITTKIQEITQGGCHQGDYHHALD